MSEQAFINIAQIKAAMEVFGRDTPMVRNALSYEVTGMFNPLNVGEFIDLLNVPVPGSVYRGDKFGIISFYRNQQLKAVSVIGTDEIDDADDAVHISSLSPHLSMGDETVAPGLFPEVHAIFLCASAEGTGVELRKLEIADEDLNADDVILVVEQVRTHLPSISERTTKLDKVTLAVANASLPRAQAG